MAAVPAWLTRLLKTPVYFMIFSLLQQPPEWHETSERNHLKRAGWGYAAAEKAGRTVTLKGPDGKYRILPGDWLVSPLKKLKYKFFGWSPVDRIVTRLNMDSVPLLAGDPRGDQPRMLQETLDDLMILFFRWFEEDNLVWPLQREVTKAALFREHYRYAHQFLREVSMEEPHAADGDSKRILSLPAYQQLSAAQMRLKKWFFDGNTFVKRDADGAEGGHYSEEHIDFMRGLPFSVLRITRGVFAPVMPPRVARLSEELAARNITTVDALLERTNFIDFFTLFDLFDEAFTQVDVLREFYRNRENEAGANLPRQILPPGQGAGTKELTALFTSPKASPAEFPKCSTLKCCMRLTWESTPVRVIKVEKENVNSLKLLLVGNSGEAEALKGQDTGWAGTIKRLLGFDELQQTVAALKDWHAREKADAVLGLGNILGIPTAASVRSGKFDTKWYDVFVKGAGLDVPWLMTIGEQEGLLSPATPIRYHYTLQRPNWHMPNDMYTVVFQFEADLKLENNGFQHDAFNVTIVNLNTWALLTGNPITNNLQTQLSKLTWISQQLFAATRRNSTWVIVMGHHPLVSTGVEGEQARMQYMDDVYEGYYYRGWEHYMMHHLLFHYQVDAYISGHDYLMEYNTMEDLQKNTTITFITSGATARLMDRTIGRGWIGRLRGALYPILCFAGRRIFFALDPGGCTPRSAEDISALSWFGPRFGNYKLNLGDRALRATGFTSLQLTKDHMIVELIDGRTKKPATRRLQRRSNKAIRDVTFADPAEVGRKTYEELKLNREKFGKANLKRFRKEVYFAKRCPIFAERLTAYIREINSQVDRYEKVRREKEVFEVMTEEEVEDAAAGGVDVDQEVQSAAAEMRAVAKYYSGLKKKYLDLLPFKDSLPEREDPRQRELLQHEKALMTLKKQSLDLVRKLELGASAEVGRQHVLLKRKILNLSATIEELEKNIKASSARISESTSSVQKLHQANTVAKEQLIARLRQTEEVLRQLQTTFPETRTAGVEVPAGGTDEVRQQVESKLKELRAQLSVHLEPVDPSFVWQRQQELYIAEAKLKHLTDYIARTQKEVPLAAETLKGDVSRVVGVQAQRQKLQTQVQTLRKLLELRQVTPLQQQYLDKKAALAMAELVEEQRNNLSDEETKLQRVQQSLESAAAAKKRLISEVEQLDRQVKEELRKAFTEWQKRQARKNAHQGEATAEIKLEQHRTLETNDKRNTAGSRAEQEKQGSDMAGKSTFAAVAKNSSIRRLSEISSLGVRKQPIVPRGRALFTEAVKQWDEEQTEKHRGCASPPGYAALDGEVRKLSASTSREALTEEARDFSSQPQVQSPELSSAREKHETGAESLEGPADGAKVQLKGSREPKGGGEPTSTTGAKQPAPTPVTQEVPAAATHASAQDKKDTVAQPASAKGETPKVKRKPGKVDSDLVKGKSVASSKTSEFQDTLPPGEKKEIPPTRIDTGPLDICHMMPMLDVLVRRALNPAENEKNDVKCQTLFAKRALERQLKTFTKSQLLSKGIQGLGAGVHPAPSVHVSRGWRLYFQDTPPIMFKTLMKDLKLGLLFIAEMFKRETEATALQKELENKRRQAAAQEPSSPAMPDASPPAEHSPSVGARTGSLSSPLQSARFVRQSSSLPKNSFKAES